MNSDFFDSWSRNQFVRGEELYILSRYSIEFVEDCSLRNIAILGIEGFQHENHQITPLLSEIADFSCIFNSASTWQECVNQCNSAAKDFLEIFGKCEGKVFNFVLVTENEWIKENA